MNPQVDVGLVFVVAVAGDQNWFYSTLAQSTAAIVGLIGAFLIQRILALRSEIIPERTSLRSDAAKCWGEISTLRKQFDNWIGQAVAVKTSLENATPESNGSVDIQGSLNVPTTLGTWTVVMNPSVPHYLGGGEVATLIDLLDSNISAAQSARSLLPDDHEKYMENPVQIKVYSAPALAQVDRSLIPGNWLPVFEAPRAVSNLGSVVAATALEVNVKVTSFQSRLSLGSFRFLWWTLTFLLVTGVLAPLMFLGPKFDFGKISLTILLVLGLTGLLGYYQFELRRLAGAADLRAAHL